jgi:hypothetical protein
MNLDRYFFLPQMSGNFLYRMEARSPVDTVSELKQRRRFSRTIAWANPVVFTPKAAV